MFTCKLFIYKVGMSKFIMYLILAPNRDFARYSDKKLPIPSHDYVLEFTSIQFNRYGVEGEHTYTPTFEFII